jgi:hypothetical protein
MRTFVGRKAPTQVFDEPTGGTSESAPTLPYNVERETEGAPAVLCQLQPTQAAGANMILHQVCWHAAPAKAGQQIFQAAAEIGEAPDARASDATRHGRRGMRTVGPHELDVALQDI